MADKPLYPGFTELDLNRATVEDFTDLPTHVQRIAEQITDDAIYMHDERHDGLRHPMCHDCEWETYPGTIRYRALEAIPGWADIKSSYAGVFHRHVYGGGPDDKFLDKLADAGINHDLATAVLEATRANKRWSEVHDEVSSEVKLRAARYFTIHGRAPADNFDQGANDDGDDLYLTRDQLAQLPSPEWLVDRILPEYSYIVLAGRDHTYKSFIAVSLACSMATGKAWLGRDAQARRVLYIAGEGAHGLDQRIAAWEYAWNHGQPVPGDQLVTRKEAINLFRGGPALERLLERIRVGEYGLVVIDTLNKSSGPANANGFDANQILASIEKIKRATTAGSVLVVSHTDKSDIDTRGFSGFEDDADVVWHARRDGNSLALVNRKMKEAPDGERLELTAVPVLDSLIIQGGDDRLLLDDANASQAAIAKLLAETFTHTGATKAELRDECGLPRSTFYRSLNKLLESGRVTATGTSSNAIYRIAIPTGDGTPIPTTTAALGHQSLNDSHDSHVVSPDSHPPADDSHRSPTSLDVGRWESGELAEMEGAS